MANLTVTAGKSVTLSSNKFTRAKYQFTGWNTEQDGSGVAYANSKAYAFTADTTLYAQWAVKTFTVTWQNPDGTVLYSKTSVEYGTETPKYEGQNPPVRAADAEFSYRFLNWDSAPETITANTTITAVYDAVAHVYADPVYEWANDYSKVTATRSSTNGGTAQTETVNTTNEVTKAATCEEKGETTYTATFDNTAFETQTITVANVEALGHEWGEPEYVWTDRMGLQRRPGRRRSRRSTPHMANRPIRGRMTTAR